MESKCVDVSIPAGREESVDLNQVVVRAHLGTDVLVRIGAFRFLLWHVHDAGSGV